MHVVNGVCGVCILCVYVYVVNGVGCVCVCVCVCTVYVIRIYYDVIRSDFTSRMMGKMFKYWIMGSHSVLH